MSQLLLRPIADNAPSAGGPKDQPMRRARTNRRMVVALAVWFIGVALLSMTGVIARVPIQAFPLLAALGIIVPTVLYFRNADVREAFDAWGQRNVLRAHSWRIPAAITFWLYGAAHMLPPTFVRNAAWGDFIAGLLGLAVARWWPQRRGFLVFHVFGFADFLLAVGTGFTLSVLNTPTMTNIETFPLALIPLFGVGLSGASHLASLAQLAAGRERL